MEKLNKSATAIFESIIKLLNGAEHKKIDNTESVFMPLTVEKIGSDINFGSRNADLYSFAHYYEQNGDLMADPEMTFLVFIVEGETWVLPTSYSQANLGLYEESIFLNGITWQIRKKQQKDHVIFSNMWLKNIKEQQGI